MPFPQQRQYRRQNPRTFASGESAMRLTLTLLFGTVAAVLTQAPARADQRTRAAVVRIVARAGREIGTGTGFAVTPREIVTNAHVVETERGKRILEVSIVPTDGTKPLLGKVRAVDDNRDLAVIHVEGRRFETLPLYAGQASPGATATALGYPYNVDDVTMNSLRDLTKPTPPVQSQGTISAERDLDGVSAWLHTAAIAQGNSGGPLLDECGRVIGVNAYVTDSGGGNSPFAFAIASSELVSFLHKRGQSFQQIGNPCLTSAEQFEREQRARLARAQLDSAAERATARLQATHENHLTIAAFLILLAANSGVFGAALLVKKRGNSEPFFRRGYKTNI